MYEFYTGNRFEILTTAETGMPFCAPKSRPNARPRTPPLARPKLQARGAGGRRQTGHGAEGDVGNRGARMPFSPASPPFLAHF